MATAKAPAIGGFRQGKQNEADIAQEVMQNYKQGLRATGAKVVMPGGRIIDASPYLSGKYKSADHTSILSNVERHLTPEWVADHPGWHYCWPRADDKMLAGRIRSHTYDYVPEDALIETTDLPYFTHKTVKGEETVQVYDVVLCAMSPENYARLYEETQNRGVRAIAGHVDMFQGEVDKMGGRGDAWQEP